MANVHMILQGKGGVGKSFIAAVLAQYMNAMDKKPLCIDTDPVNATFHGYKALNVHKLEIMEGDEFITSGLDRIYPKGLPVGTIASIGPRVELSLMMVRQGSLVSGSTARNSSGVGRSPATRNAAGVVMQICAIRWT